MLVEISSIKVKKRVRRDLGDIEPLKQSLSKYGLLNPITITDKDVLVAGERRLEAAKALGWQRINANIIDNLSKKEQLALELDENNVRKSFTQEEADEGLKKLKRLENPNFFIKLLDKIATFFINLFHKLFK